MSISDKIRAGEANTSRIEMERLGYRTIPHKPGSRDTLHSDWLKRDYDKFDWGSHFQNEGAYSLALGGDDLVVAVRPDGAGDLDTLEYNAGLGNLVDEYPQVLRGSGTRYLFMKKDASTTVPSHLDDYPGLTFYQGGLVIGPGSPDPDNKKRPARTGQWARSVPRAPAKLLKLVGRAAAQRIVFEPYSIKPHKLIPPRPYLMEPAYIRKFVTGTTALGAMGKTTFLVTEALELVTGQSLLGGPAPRGKFRVVFWNGEDPLDELDRKFAATCMHYGITADDIGDSLSVYSGRDLPIRIAEMSNNGPVFAQPEVDALVAALQTANADVLIVDPAISTHTLPENDNTAMEQWAQAWNLVAERANVAVHIASHTGKVRGRDSDALDMRGASAILNKLRYSRVFNRLSKEDAAKIGINPNMAGLHMRIDDAAKANLQPPGASARWFKLESVDLGNADFAADGIHAKSDRMGVAVEWTYPDFVVDVTTAQVAGVLAAMDDRLWRKTWTNPNKAEWVGVPIADTLRLDVEDPADRTRIRELIERWAGSGVLVTATGKNGQRQVFEGYKAGVLPGDVSDEDDEE